jgi:hypothetical protein
MPLALNFHRDMGLSNYNLLIYESSIFRLAERHRVDGRKSVGQLISTNGGKTNNILYPLTNRLMMVPANKPT